MITVWDYGVSGWGSNAPLGSTSRRDRFYQWLLQNLLRCWRGLWLNLCEGIISVAYSGDPREGSEHRIWLSDSRKLIITYVTCTYVGQLNVGINLRAQYTVRTPKFQIKCKTFGTFGSFSYALYKIIIQIPTNFDCFNYAGNRLPQRVRKKPVPSVD